MAIVLVIIGFIVGGVLLGQDLIRSAETRATISQIEKYNTAVNTFRGKFNALPGDLNGQVATQFGFAARGALPGEGDGNGIMESVYGTNGTTYGCLETVGENAMFWVDLTTANGLNLNLIDGGFNTANSTTQPATPSIITGTGLNLYLPEAKLGRGSYIYVWSQNSVNYFGISGISKLYNYGALYAYRSITVRQSYDMDTKIDDGLPQSGRITAQALLSQNPGWLGASDTSATGGGPGTCYDNSSGAAWWTGINGATQHYSIEVNNGNGANCELSFQFQ